MCQAISSLMFRSSHLLLPELQYLKIFTNLKSKSHFIKTFILPASMKDFKNDEKCFLFYVKSSFCSRDIQIFVPTFLVMQTFLVKHISSNISRSESSQTIKFGQLIEYIMENMFLEKSLQNVVQKLVRDAFRRNRN